MTLSLKIALRFLKSDRNQTLFIIFGIAVGISVQIFVGVLVQSLQNDLTDELVGNSAHILIKSNLDEKTISSWEEITSQVEKTDSVTSVNAVVDMPGLLKSGDGSASILIRGFNFEDANEIYELDTAIYESTELDHGYEVIVGKNLKERLYLDMNDVIQIITPDGRFSSFKVTGFYDLGLAIINESWIIMDFETAQNLFKLDGSVTSIEIQVEDVFTADGQEGFIVEAGNSSILSEKIKYFYDNPNKIIEMGAKARTRIVNEFTFDSVAKRIVNYCKTKL